MRPTTTLLARACSVALRRKSYTLRRDNRSQTLATKGIGTSPLVALVVVVILVAGTVGYFVLESPSTGSSSSTITTQTTSQSVSLGSTSGQVLMELGPNTIFLTPGGSENYTLLTLVPLSTGGVSQMTLKVVSPPSGITASFASPGLDITSGSQTDVLTIAADQGVAPGTYQLSINGVAGSINETQQFSFNVAKYVVFMNNQMYQPSTLNVPSGATVVFMNLEGRISQYDSGLHDVYFTSGASVTSPSLAQYGTWSYTFTGAGTYSYYCTFHPFMKGTITVSP
jgi:plastocyanin